MDALSSQATVAGYKAVLLARRARCRKFFPMLMTAAGTIPPAKVLVLGAGVAGLQAIATARRLGAVVEAFDVRPAVQGAGREPRREVRRARASRGERDRGRLREGADAEEQQRREQELLAERVAESDGVITTARDPGPARADARSPPRWSSAMRPGSVIVDLAAETGGNCELTEPGEIVVARRRDDRRHARTCRARCRSTRASCTRATSPTLLAAPRAGRASSSSTSTTRSSRGACVTHDGTSTSERRDAMSADARSSRAHDLRARGLRRLRGDLEGADDAAHAADVGHQRDPRHRAGRRDAGRSAPPTRRSSRSLGFVAVVFGTVNVVGGFLVTDRMLEMFKKREPRSRRDEPRTTRRSRSRRTSSTCSTWSRRSCFILGIKRPLAPDAPRARGNLIARGRHGDRGRRHARSTGRSTATG